VDTENILKSVELKLIAKHSSLLLLLKDEGGFFLSGFYFIAGFINQRHRNSELHGTQLQWL
jgi:hypothetical protein